MVLHFDVQVLYLIENMFSAIQKPLYLRYKTYMMDIRTEKLKLIELLLHTNNPSIIEKIKSIFQSEDTQDIWEELSLEQQEEIDGAVEEVKNGQTVAFDTFIAKHK